MNTDSLMNNRAHERVHKICQTLLMNVRTKFSRIGKYLTNLWHYLWTDEQNLPELANISQTYAITYERTNKICQNWQISHTPMTLLMNGQTKFARIGKYLTNLWQYLWTDEQNLPELANISRTYDITYERTNKICQNWQISHKPKTLLMNGRTKFARIGKYLTKLWQ